MTNGNNGLNQCYLDFVKENLGISWKLQLPSQNDP